MATLSQPKSGFLRLMHKPISPQKNKNIWGITSINTVIIGVVFNKIINTTEHINAAGAVTRKCKNSFPLRICHPLTGNDCIIHKFFPSSETDGADTQFIEHIKQIIKQIAGGTISGINKFNSLSTSLYIIPNTAPAIKSKVPKPQFSI